MLSFQVGTAAHLILGNTKSPARARKILDAINSVLEFSCHLSGVVDARIEFLKKFPDDVRRVIIEAWMCKAGHVAYNGNAASINLCEIYTDAIKAGLSHCI